MAPLLAATMAMTAWITKKIKHAGVRESVEPFMDITSRDAMSHSRPSVKAFQSV